MDQIRDEKWGEIRLKNFSELVSFLAEIWVQKISKCHFFVGRVRQISIEITKECCPGGGAETGFLAQWIADSQTKIGRISVQKLDGFRFKNGTKSVTKNRSEVVPKIDRNPAQKWFETYSKNGSKFDSEMIQKSSRFDRDWSKDPSKTGKLRKKWDLWMRPTIGTRRRKERRRKRKKERRKEEGKEEKRKEKNWAPPAKPAAP